jgi:hypothetical protein
MPPKKDSTVTEEADKKKKGLFRRIFGGKKKD